MLLLEAKVYFEKQNDSLPHDLSTKNIIRPVVNLGENRLFSGTIITDKNTDKIIRGEWYNVIIEMPTIEQDAYKEISFLLRIGGTFILQSGSRIIGKGRIINSLFY